jgi:hypothetical protein
MDFSPIKNICGIGCLFLTFRNDGRSLLRASLSQPRTHRHHFGLRIQLTHFEIPHSGNVAHRKEGGPVDHFDMFRHSNDQWSCDPVFRLPGVISADAPDAAFEVSAYKSSSAVTLVLYLFYDFSS